MGLVNTLSRGNGWGHGIDDPSRFSSTYYLKNAIFISQFEVGNWVFINNLLQDVY